jgi:methionine biosynthesis protein MetW
MTDTPRYHQERIFDPERAHPDDAHSLVMRLVRPGTRVLELGCASGYLSGYMERELGCRVTGLEADPVAAGVAATRCGEVHTVDLDSPEALDCARASAPYDLLLAAAILEHLKNPERVLRVARDLLAPGARAVVSLPNVAHWSIRWRLLRGRFDYEEYGVMDRTHLRWFTLETGRALLEGQGYRVEQVRIAGSGLQNALNAVVRPIGLTSPPLVLPGVLGYELIYVARPRDAADTPQRVAERP